MLSRGHITWMILNHLPCCPSAEQHSAARGKHCYLSSTQQQPYMFCIMHLSLDRQPADKGSSPGNMAQSGPVRDCWENNSSPSKMNDVQEKTCIQTCRQSKMVVDWCCLPAEGCCPLSVCYSLHEIQLSTWIFHHTEKSVSATNKWFMMWSKMTTWMCRYLKPVTGSL